MNRVRYCDPLCKKIVVPDNVEAFLDEYRALRIKYGFELYWNDHDSIALIVSDDMGNDALECASLDIKFTDVQDPPEHKYLHPPAMGKMTEAFLRYVQYKANFIALHSEDEPLDFRQYCAHLHGRAYWLLTPHIQAGVQPPGA
jgi:hypothetical protein